MTESPSPKRRRGGQPGNVNAVKHGFYSAHFHQAEVAALETTHFTGLADEIALLRLYIRRVVELGAGHDNFSDSLDLLRILCLAAATLTRMLKTHRLLATGEDEVSVALRKALEDIHASLAATGKMPPDDWPANDWSANDSDANHWPADPAS